MAFYIPFDGVRGRGSIITTSAPANRQVEPPETPVFTGYKQNRDNYDGI